MSHCTLDFAGFQGVCTGVSALQLHCKRVTLLASAWPCAHSPFVSEGGQFPYEVILPPIYTASRCRAWSSLDTAAWSSARAVATLRQVPALMARFVPAPSQSSRFWSASDLIAAASFLQSHSAEMCLTRSASISLAWLPRDNSSPRRVRSVRRVAFDHAPAARRCRSCFCKLF